MWLIDPEDNGKMMKATEVDEIVHRSFRTGHAHDGYDYDTGLPLDEEGMERAREECANHVCRRCCQCVPPCPQSLMTGLEVTR